jgi:hypothetical protein
VKSIWKKAERNQSEDILLGRFEKGAVVPRVLYPERGAHQDTVFYSIFGPTVVSTNEGVHRILETRAIPINMPETRRRFENDVRPDLSLPLKERLVAFRATRLRETFPDIPKPAPGRLGDILKPLQQVIRHVRPDREPAFLGLVRDLEVDRQIERAESLEAELLSTILKEQQLLDKGALGVKDITDSLNSQRSERSQLTYQRVGRILKAMGFRKGKTRGGASAIIWDDQKIAQMKETYGLQETSETSETPVTSTL